jgi:glycosyltransferase involved in cell wall biosynthesis
LKLLHVISRVNPSSGGPIQGIRNFESDIVNYNTERHIVCFEEPAEIALWDFPKSLYFHALGKAKTIWQYNKNLIPFLKQNATNYDVIIINGIWSYHSYAVIKTINWLKINKPNSKLPKVYIMPHGMLDPWFQKDKSRRWKAFRNYIYWHLIEKNVVNSANSLLFTCEEELLLARTTFSGYRPKQELNIGYGIEAPPIQSEAMKIVFEEKSGFDSNEPYLLFLSRIHPKKGLDLLLKAYQYLLNDPALDCKIPHLIIAGPGIETEYGKGLLKYLEENDAVKAKVQFVGHLSGDAKWGAIYGCEAFILPSHQENFGIAVAEALACYKPVLITNKVNIYREIDQGGGGIISEDTLEGTIANLKKWMNLNKSSKDKMGQDAYMVYQKHFDVKNSVTRLLDTIKINIINHVLSRY